MRKFSLVVFSLVLAIGMLIGVQGVAKADYILDFSTGSTGGAGGTVTLSDFNAVLNAYTVAVGNDIELSNLLVFSPSTPAGGTNYAVTSGTGLPYALLDFNTAAGTIEVWGSVPSLGVGTSSPVELLTGTISSSFYFNTFDGIDFVASGPDTKYPGLLTALGIPASTSFYMSGVVTVANGPEAGSTSLSPVYVAYSTDLSNNGTTVPVPPSALLLAPGLLGLVGIRKRLKG